MAVKLWTMGPWVLLWAGAMCVHVATQNVWWYLAVVLVGSAIFWHTSAREK